MENGMGLVAACTSSRDGFSAIEGFHYGYN